MRVSVCLAACNGERYIQEQIESIIPQLEAGDEFLVADDGSSDDTLSILLKYNQNITVLLSGRVGGVNKNYERLISASKNDGILLVDQDDVWLPNRLNLIRSGLSSSYLVISNGFVADQDLNLTGESIFQFVERKNGFISNLYKNTYVGCCMAFRRELINKALPFHNNLHAHDWLIGLLGELDGRVLEIYEPTLLYRRHASNQSRTGLKSNNSLGKKMCIRVLLLINLFIIQIKKSIWI